jgi:hypothetical protein
MNPFVWFSVGYNLNPRPPPPNKVAFQSNLLNNFLSTAAVLTEPKAQSNYFFGNIERF